MAAIHSNGGNRWNNVGFNFTKRDALSSVYKISMTDTCCTATFTEVLNKTQTREPHARGHCKNISKVECIFAV